jgi:transketolase
MQLQNLPCLKHSSIEAVAKGAYTVLPVEGGAAPKVIIVATGSEVYIAIEAAELLCAEGVPAAVVSMPCWKLFDQQSLAYKQEGKRLMSNVVVLNDDWSNVLVERRRLIHEGDAPHENTN